MFGCSLVVAYHRPRLKSENQAGSRRTESTQSSLMGLAYGSALDPRLSYLPLTSFDFITNLYGVKLFMLTVPVPRHPLSRLTIKFNSFSIMCFIQALSKMLANYSNTNNRLVQFGLEDVSAMGIDESYVVCFKNKMWFQMVVFLKNFEVMNSLFLIWCYYFRMSFADSCYFSYQTSFNQLTNDCISCIQFSLAF